MEPDVLYVVKRGERNDALRLSLRSLGNLPHRRVFIAGYCPSWVRGVTAVPAVQRSDKYANIEGNLKCGLSSEGISDDVVYMNDDFYVTRPLDRVPITHGGPTDEYPGRHELRIRMRRTVQALRGSDAYGGERTLAYDGVHTPLPLVRPLALQALATAPRRGLWRTWYGNLCGIGGERVSDAKHRGPAPLQCRPPTLLSTSPGGLQVLREVLEDILPKDCPYL